MKPIGQSSDPDAYKVVLADLRNRRDQLETAIKAIEAAMGLTGVPDVPPPKRTTPATRASGIEPTEPGSVPQPDGLRITRSDNKTREIGMLILRNADKTPEDIFEICKGRGIETTLNTVDELRRYYRKCIDLTARLRQQTPQSLVGGKTDKIGVLILQNPTKTSAEILEMCKRAGIDTKPKTVHGYWLYFHQCVQNITVIENEQKTT